MDPAASTRPRRKRTITRVIAAVAVWLVVGAVLTVATTWSGILVENERLRSRNRVPRYLPSVSLPRELKSGGPLRISATELRSWWVDEIIYDYARHTVSTNERHVPCEWRAGWPARSLVRLRWEVVPPGLRPRGGEVVLPLRPRWPGFAANTLFYAAIASALWHGPSFLSRLRRHRRRIRGLCLRCAYNRAGLAPGAVCPECGDVPRPAASVASV